MSDDAPYEPPASPPPPPPGSPPPSSPPPGSPPPPSSPPPGFPPPPGGPSYGAPSPGGFPGRTAVTEPLPWEQRETLGFMPALLDTVKVMLTGPAAAFRRIRSDGDYVSPFLFALIVGWVMAAVNQVWSLAFSSLLGPMGQNDIYEQLGMPIPSVGVMASLAQLVIYPFILVFVLFLSAGLLHLCLLMVGGLERSEAGFEGTFNVVSYGQVGSLGYVVPVIGPFIALAVFLVLGVIGFQEVHKSSTPQAVIAVLIPLALCCVCFGAIMALTMMGIAGMAAGI